MKRIFDLNVVGINSFCTNVGVKSSVKSGVNFSANFGMKAMTIALSSIALAIALSTVSGANAEAAPKYPGKRISGASRSVRCPATPLNITALVPELDAQTSTKTTVEDPIVWVYIPYAKSDTNPFDLELRVTDPTGLAITRNIPLPTAAGIMPIVLPSGVTLGVGKSYGWALRATCEDNAPFDIRLTIDRVAALPQSPLATSQSPSKIEFYAKKSIWLNAMTEVIKLNGKRPTLTLDAQKFLLKKLDGEDFKTTGLEPNYLQKITQQPIVR